MKCRMRRFSERARRFLKMKYTVERVVRSPCAGRAELETERAERPTTHGTRTAVGASRLTDIVSVSGTGVGDEKDQRDLPIRDSGADL